MLASIFGRTRVNMGILDTPIKVPLRSFGHFQKAQAALMRGERIEMLGIGYKVISAQWSDDLGRGFYSLVQQVHLDATKESAARGGMMRQTYGALCALAEQHGVKMTEEVRAFVRAVEQADGAQPIAWESKTPFFRKYLTQATYERLGERFRSWYKPYRCSNCGGAEPADEPVSAGVGKDQLEEIVRQVETAVGMNREAWDCIEATEIVGAVLSIARIHARGVQADSRPVAWHLAGLYSCDNTPITNGFFGSKEAAQEVAKLLLEPIIKPLFTAPPAEAAQPFCVQCGDGIMAHNPGTCGNCHEMGGSTRTDGVATALANLVNAARWWGSQEDGVPAEVVPAFSAAHLALGWSLSHPTDFNAILRQAELRVPVALSTAAQEKALDEMVADAQRLGLYDKPECGS